MHRPRPILALLLLAAAARGQSFDELLPDSTVFYLSIENLSRTRERFGKSPLNALWEHEETQAFAAVAKTRWEAWNEEARKEDGFSPAEVFRTVAGQVVLAMSRIVVKEDDLEPSLLVLADIGDKADEVRRMAAAAERAAEEKGARFRRDEEDFRGVTLVHYRRASGEEDGGPSCWFLAGSLFGAADDPEDLKAVLARRGAGPQGSLAGIPAYARIRQRLGGRADLVAYGNGPAFFDLVAKQMQPGTAPALGALGVNGIEGVGVQVTLQPDSVTLSAFLATTGKKEGVLKLLDGANSGALPPRFVPADATSAATFTLSLPELWAEARRTADRIQPGMAAMMDASMEQLKGQTGVDLRTDVFDALGTQVVYYQRLPDKPGEAAPGPFGPAAGLPAFVLAWSVKDKARLEGALQVLYAQAGPMLQEGEFLGTKYRVLNLPMLPVQPALTVLPDQLVVALSLDDLKDVLTRYGKDVKGLVDQPEFRRAIEHLPPQRFSLGFTREARALRQGFLAGFLSGLDEAGGHLFDRERMPSQETLERYLDVAGTAMVNEEAGVFYTYRLNLKPQG